MRWMRGICRAISPAWLFVSVPGLFDLHAEDILFHGYSIYLFLDYLILLLFKKKVKFNRRARVIFVRFCL